MRWWPAGTDADGAALDVVEAEAAVVGVDSDAGFLLEFFDASTVPVVVGAESDADFLLEFSEVSIVPVDDDVSVLVESLLSSVLLVVFASLRFSVLPVASSSVLLVVFASSRFSVLPVASSFAPLVVFASSRSSAPPAVSSAAQGTSALVLVSSVPQAFFLAESSPG